MAPKIKFFNQAQKIIFLDGAMGTSLQKAGAPLTPISNITHRQIVKEITKGYISAGSDIILTNTFSATSLKYKNFREINSAAVCIAKEAVAESGMFAAGGKSAASGKNVKIAGCIGPTGKMVVPVGSLDFEDAVKVFKSQIKILASSGVDMIIIETMDDISEMRAALIAAKETSPKLKIIATMTFSERDTTSTGTPPEVAARVMETLGAEVVGVNCSSGPRGLLNIVRRMRRVTKKPIAVQSNAGIPFVLNGKTLYPVAPREFTSLTKKLVRAGASYIGGCCGTTKEHIASLVKGLKNIKPLDPLKNVPLIITSRSRWAEFGIFPLIIGERINFIAHPELKKSLNKIVNEGLKQHKAGADALDVNLGQDEEKALKVVDVLSRKVDIPIVLDSQNALTVSDVARYYPGVLMLNSISAEEKKLNELLPVVKKYGMPFIPLCVDSKGVGKTVKDKIRIYKKIVSSANEKGISSENIVVDLVTLAVSSDTSSAVKTLDALGCNKIENHTVLGISNVSSSFPQRALLNQIFSALSVGAGCSALIVNPLDTDLMYSVYSAALLSGRDKNAKRYLDYFSPKKEESDYTFDNKLADAILKGDAETALKEAKNQLKILPALKIIKNYIVPALDKVGEFYSSRVIFLPQLIESARASEKALEYLQKVQKKLGKKQAEHIKGRIIIATVQGDIHDIGKNLVALMLRNHSFEVKDLGVDVDSKEIIREAKNWGANIIALSSLMTTTMDRMAEVVDILKREKFSVPVIVGGAAITKEYARSIGAGYAKDAVDAVKVAKGLPMNKGYYLESHI